MENLSAPPLLPIDQLAALQDKTAPFAPGEAYFWTDPHIAAQMPAFHLDPNMDAASRRPEIIRRSADWIVHTLGLQAGNPLLDLGCGPGLYVAHLAQSGLRVTGVDFSQNSIGYAISAARREGLEIECYNFINPDGAAP